MSYELLNEAYDLVNKDDGQREQVLRADIARRANHLLKDNADNEEDIHGIVEDINDVLDGVMDDYVSFIVNPKQELIQCIDNIQTQLAEIGSVRSPAHVIVYQLKQQLHCLAGM